MVARVIDSNCHLHFKPLYFRDSVGTSDITVRSKPCLLLSCGAKEAPWFDLIVTLQEGKEDCRFGIKYISKM